MILGVLSANRKLSRNGLVGSLSGEDWRTAFRKEKVL